MLNTLAVSNYRSLQKSVIPLGQLNLITGPNGSGKSNLYRSLRLLAETAQTGVVGALAREGGLESTLWAGPEKISREMREGKTSIQGGPRKDSIRLRLGFADDEFGYAISLGLPPPSRSAFALDPEIKRESIWAGPFYRPSSLLVDRLGPVVKRRNGRGFEVVAQHMNAYDSLFGQLADPNAMPEVLRLRENIRAWRFYDQFRTDQDAPSRLPQLGTRTFALRHDGGDLAAALQTILEIGDDNALHAAIGDAFPGSHVSIVSQRDGWFAVEFHQQGLLRPLAAAELSDGTLRYLLWVAALLTPRLPPLMVLNEPETSLHPDLLPALARLIVRASSHTQVWVVSHANQLVSALGSHPVCHLIELKKDLGQTLVMGLGVLDEPTWHWPN